MTSRAAQIEHANKVIREREIKRVNERNKEIDKYKMAYKIRDKEGNVFYFVGIENDCPLYRVHGELTHVMNLKGMEVIEKYCSIS